MSSERYQIKRQWNGTTYGSIVSLRRHSNSPKQGRTARKLLPQSNTLLPLSNWRRPAQGS